MRLVCINTVPETVSVWEDRNEIARYSIIGEMDLETVLSLLEPEPFEPARA